MCLLVLRRGVSLGTLLSNPEDLRTPLFEKHTCVARREAERSGEICIFKN